MLLDEIGVDADVLKVREYPIMAAVNLGLELIAAEQARELFGGRCSPPDTQRGKVFFCVAASLAQLVKIRCADNLYYFIAKIPVGTNKASIIQLAQEIQAIRFSEFLPFFCDVRRKIRVHVTASRSGKHSFSRFYAADRVLEALSAPAARSAVFEKGDALSHDLHFRLDVMEDAAYFSLKLTSAAYRYRGNYRQFMPGALRPSVANALVWLSRPDKNDVVLDPFCGSGTIVSEREYYPYRKILAFDIEQEAVEAAKSNVSGHVIVRRGDACRLPLNGHCADRIITNAPWGARIRVGDIYQLYGAFMREAFRVLKRDGRCILLTDKTEVLERVSRELGLNAAPLVQISLHGLHPSVYQISV
ncbi:MAG: RNA methyltransferase [Clostridiales bacterium]|nr:RNA methyltransferase [Clostridiales bacterium]